MTFLSPLEYNSINILFDSVITSLIFLLAKPRFVVVMMMTVFEFKPPSFKLESANFSIVAALVTVHNLHCPTFSGSLCK